MKAIPNFLNMRQRLSLLLHFFFVCSLIHGQSLYSDTLIKMLPQFQNNKTYSYVVKQEIKTKKRPRVLTDFFAQYKVQVSATDSMNNLGYYVTYKIETVDAMNDDHPLESVKANMVHSVLLYYSINRLTGEWNLLNADEVRKHLLKRLVEMNPGRHYSKDQLLAVDMLKEKLKTVEGLSLFFQDFLCYNSVFGLGHFRKKEVHRPGVSVDLFHRKDIPGVLTKKIMSVNEEKRIVKLYSKFLGNKDSAAKRDYLSLEGFLKRLEGTKVDYSAGKAQDDLENEFEINMNDGCIRKLTFKRERFILFKHVTKIEMELLPDE